MRSAHEHLTHAERAALAATAGDLARAGQAVALADESAVDERPRLTTWEQMYALLMHAAGFDGRERGEYEARTWLKALDGFAIEDVEQAITEHYRRSRFPVMPADVIQIIEEGVRP